MGSTLSMCWWLWVLAYVLVRAKPLWYSYTARLCIEMHALQTYGVPVASRNVFHYTKAKFSEHVVCVSWHRILLNCYNLAIETHFHSFHRKHHESNRNPNRKSWTKELQSHPKMYRAHEKALRSTLLLVNVVYTWERERVAYNSVVISPVPPQSLTSSVYVNVSMCEYTRCGKCMSDIMVSIRNKHVLRAISLQQHIFMEYNIYITI